MSTRAASRLAWTLAGLSVTIFVAGVALYVLANPAQEAHDSSTMSDATLLRIVVLNVPFLVFLLVGALISSRRPRQPCRLDLSNTSCEPDACERGENKHYLYACLAIAVHILLLWNAGELRRSAVFLAP
jgi:hypothetical protein